MTATAALLLLEVENALAQRPVREAKRENMVVAQMRFVERPK